MAFRDFLNRVFGQAGKLSDLMLDKEFVNKVCEQAGFASLRDEALGALVEECVDEADRLSFRKDQMVGKFADGIRLISARQSISGKLQSVCDAVEEKAKESRKNVIQPGIFNVACGIIAAYYVEGMIESGMYIEAD